MAEEKKTMQSFSSDGYKRVFDIPKDLQEKAHVKSMEQYEEMYKRSIDDPEGFWGEMAEQNIEFFKKWDKVLDYEWGDKIKIEWFKGAKLKKTTSSMAVYLVESQIMTFVNPLIDSIFSQGTEVHKI